MNHAHIAAILPSDGQDRGKMLRLSKSEVLLILTGPRDVKRPEDGLPSPVLLRLHRESTFTDTTYLARQVYYTTSVGQVYTAVWDGALKNYGPNLGYDYGGRLVAAWLER